MLATKSVLTGYVAGIGSPAVVALVQGAVGGLVGLAVFGGMLYVLGIEQEDREFMSENIPG
jgi:hypothetical protein